MTVVSNDPSWWPMISFAREYSYFSVAALAIVAYDWALTVGQEVELVWQMQRWSLMTVVYLGMRYIGMPFSVFYVIPYLLSVSLTDAVSLEYGILLVSLINSVANAMVGVIMITRLYVMYQQSRKMLIFLIAIYVIILVASNVIFAIQIMDASAVEYVLSGAHLCLYDAGGSLFLSGMNWILRLVWEILVICLAVWIAVKHFRELQRPSTGWAVGDYFTVLMKTHLFYFFYCCFFS
ncbi:hypothetical protein K503DRAFT_259856 [Rhizopogon vinicolor AM-OR11-026]|uniref:DUF6533 domain-containing protein n=1 Tax=Rhizopogon vinicolor AM-OR11-026 TaxID=1314800 RepID=A0A1B7MWN6_9AGAM|nr:hypothetical protein K503DRAFT_259856 [Rhizopogon vinicolor AM-OR11-026]